MKVYSYKTKDFCCMCDVPITTDEYIAFRGMCRDCWENAEFKEYLENEIKEPQK